MASYCEEVSETLGLLLHNKNEVAKGSETLRLVFTKRIVTYCEEVRETLGLLLCNSTGLEKEAKHFAYFFTIRIQYECRSSLSFSQ